MIKVLFVCLGNICRSPLAEAVFDDLLKKGGLEERISSDSAGTSDYHIGSPPDERTLDVVRQKGLSLDHLGRQFGYQDFKDFHYIIAMDESNLRNIKALEEETGEKPYKLFLMREFDDSPGDMNVPDPYWGGDRGFLDVHEIVLRSCQNLLDYIKEEHKL